MVAGSMVVAKSGEEVRCETYNGNVFVNLDPNARPLREHIGDAMARNFEAYPDHRMWKSWHFGIVVESTGRRA